MARAAFLGVLAAALCAVAMTQVVVTPYKTAAPFVRGIVKQWTVDSFGKYPVYIENTAKRPETRARRVEETARLAGENIRANQWRAAP